MTRLEALLAKARGENVSIPEPIDNTEPFYGWGSNDARVVIVLDAPSYEEYETRRPFIGRTGTKIRQHARMAGIILDKCRVEYMYPAVPLGGKFQNLSTQLRLEAASEFRERLKSLYASLIVTIGDAPLQVLLGLGDSLRRRGSVYEWRDQKVLAMLDPAIIYARKEYEKHARLDWERAKVLSVSHMTHHQYCGCAHKIKRTHHTHFSYIPGREKEFSWLCMRYLEVAQCLDTVMAIDIETPKVQGKRKIVCVSFSYKAHESLVLHFDEEKNLIRNLCESPCIKTGHNFISFDRWWLHKEGIHVEGEIYDTLAMHHALDPASRHSLEFLTSQYTYEPFYKAEAKGHDENAILKTVKAQSAYYEYCGLDACVTRELYDILWSQLEARQLLDFYHRHYTRLFDPILDVSSRGVRIDQVARKALLAACLEEARVARDRLGVINGAPLYKTAKTGAKKMVSNAQLKVLLYDKLGVPARLKRRASGEHTVTADATTLRQLRAEYDKERPEVVEVIDLALEHNKAHKMASFCYDSHYDEDGRFRFTLKVNTEAARLSSSAAPNGTGANSQNSPRDRRYRQLFLPEEGHVILEADLSQVESRFCFVYTGDPELIRLAQLRSSEFDQHKFVASLIFKRPMEEIGSKSSERQVSKSIGHGAQRGMQGARMAETLIKDGHAFSVEECDVLIEEYHKAFPAIRRWHQQVRKEIRATKCLVNSWGRVWDVRYEEVNDELFRRGYSWLLQSECADLMNQQGFTRLWYYIQEHNLASRILLHTHDGLVISCPVEEVYEVAEFLRSGLEIPRTYNGVELAIPVEFSLGKNWGEKVEFPMLPACAVFTHALCLLKR